MIANWCAPSITVSRTRRSGCHRGTALPCAGFDSSGCGSETAPALKSSTTSWSFRSGHERSCRTRRPALSSAAVRSTRRSMSRPMPTAAPPAGPPTACCPTRFAIPRRSPPSTCTRGCSRTTRRSARIATRRRCWPSTPGRASSMPTSYVTTTCPSQRPSIPTISMWSGHTRRRPRRRSVASGPGSPTSSSTMGCGPTASGSSAG